MRGEEMEVRLLLAVEDVDGVAEFVPLVLFDLAAADERSQVGVWLGGGVKFSGRLGEVGDEFVGFINVGDGATSGAGDAADHALGSALAEHFAGVRIVGVDDNAIGNIAAELGVGMSGWVEHFGVDTTHAFFGVAGLDVGVAIFSNANAAHGEEARRCLGVSRA